VPEAQLKSVARMAMLSNFLREPIPGEVGHSATSALFVTNPGMLDWALYMAEMSAPGAMKLVEATEKWGTTLKKNQTAFNIARNTDLPYFDYVAKNPELGKKFSAYMRNVTSSEGTSLKHLVNGFDWAGLGDATIVDVYFFTC
jgi:6-hydroxytryprostatin B O-methyltransferase